MTVLYDADWASNNTRRCGDCQLCCKLLPIIETNKKAGARCEHQRHGKGCAIYAHRPTACAMWNCRWLANQDTADMARPDRARYVLDIVPDFIEMRDNVDGSVRKIEVVQVWCDPNHRDAWRDPALLAFLERRAREGVAALIRWSASDGMAVFAPPLSADGLWHELGRGSVGREHTGAEKAAVIQERLRGQQ